MSKKLRIGCAQLEGLDFGGVATAKLLNNEKSLRSRTLPAQAGHFGPQRLQRLLGGIGALRFRISAFFRLLCLDLSDLQALNNLLL